MMKQDTDIDVPSVDSLQPSADDVPQESERGVAAADETDALRTHVRITFSDPHAFHDLFESWRHQPTKPEQTACAITGLPAKYRDPRTGLPYANLRAFAMLRRLASGTFPWNQDIGAYTSAIDEQASATRLHLGIKGKWSRRLCIGDG
ncbi:hypothetical protein SYNPS1DRAFT_31487 [Syncephalis pseudoplumigaleata]|uniref:Vps72/YL1 C-terminal domain-containing protein n=1 Tax=Syncephalis pseudoplumigaleata TaxID=1712513 RepID=A0A4P9YSW8_9FUNG|nr:hypothetical protein SYNPS1DRAFT_31487 [Syncephalis pseudoplumigaleata]|eukprot:RKP22845.1 hypothetical protein SYNPS1DRAFT_31487 [Syncephalis pseudoplumigaleata]